MELLDAVPCLAALAHETRLSLYRALVRAGYDGLAAGHLAETLGVAPSTLSHHLSQLEQVGLIQSRRESRHIYYTAEIMRMQALLSFIVEDCCNGRPELCGIGSALC